MILTIVLTSIGALTVANGAQPSAKAMNVAQTWEAIASQWRARATHMPAIRVAYRERIFQAAGNGIRRPASRRAGRSIAPQEDLHMHADAILVLAGGRWRWDTRGEAWRSSLGKVVRRHQVMVFDGEKRLAYDEVDATPSLDTRGGWIETRKSGCLWTKLPQLVAWTILYRPFESKCSPLAEDAWTPYGALDRLSAVRGNGILLRQRFRSPAPDGPMELLIDPQRDFTVQRYARARIIVEIEYSRHPLYGWLPSNWTCTEIKSDGSGVAYESVAEVTSLEAGFTVGDSDFTVSFPRGTVVRDTTTGSGRDRTFYIRADGSEREITSAEWAAGLKYDLLEDSQPGTLAGVSFQGGRTASRFPVLLVANACLVLFALFLYFLKSRNAGGS